MNPDTLLHIRSLTAYRNERLLMRDVNFSLGRGELLQVVGPNGCGKTTLLRIIIGLLPPQEGEVLFREKLIGVDRQAYHRNVFYLGHQIGVKGDLTVNEQLRFARRCSFEKISTEVVLKELDLYDYKNEFCRNLSRGQCQRVALAMMMLSDAVLWILDEPFSALDQAAQIKVQDIFLRKIEEGGSIIFTSHQPVGVALMKRSEIKDFSDLDFANASSRLRF